MSKADLIFAKPLMNAAGTLGFAPDPRAPVPWSDFGAFVTNPLSLRARRVTGNPALLQYPGGLLLHTGLPNPGLNAVMAKYSRRWADSPVAVIAHLIGRHPETAREMTRQLEGLDNILAVELSFAPLLADDIILLALEMCSGELPLIACLRPEDVLRLGSRAMQAGAAAISLAPPRGALLQDGHPVAGRLFGPSIFPGALEVVRSAAKSGLVCIGAGGVTSRAEAEAMLGAGAIGVQLDTALWLPRETTESLVH